MIRQIIHIDEARCNGCGLCAQACHEGAIQMVGGKAKLIRDDYCDGLGNCLPVCPTGAITFVEREAEAFDPEAVAAAQVQQQQAAHACGGGCPGSRAQMIKAKAPTPSPQAQPMESQLAQWPVQIKLVPINAPYFKGAKLLIAADCTAYAYANFHREFMSGHITLIGCPKLDEGDYAEKLTAILKHNDIKSVHVVRMQVPCCSGLAHAAMGALQDCGKMIPWQVTVLSTDGEVLE